MFDKLNKSPVEIKTTLNKSILFAVLFWLIPMKLAALTFEVNVADERIKDNVIAFLSSTAYDCQSVASPISRQHEDLLSMVQSAAQPFGYFNTKIKVELPEQDECENINLNIELGPVTTIESVNINLLDSEDTELQNIIDKQPLKKGQTLNQIEYEKVKRDLINLANEKFYLDAEFSEQTIDVYPEHNQASIVLSFKPGLRYQISVVNIEVDEAFLRPGLIENLITIETNKNITQSELYNLKQKLNSYGYFNQVLFEIGENDTENGTVPITIRLSPAAKYDYSVGLGFSTDKGAKASFKYNNYRVNDRGHQFKSQLNLSEVTNELITDYKIPTKNRPASNWYNIQLGYRDEQTDNIESQTTKLGFSETRIIRGRWQNINFLDILYESFDTGVEQGDAFLVVPGTSWSLTDADNVARPDYGYKVQTELKGASEDILSDASFFQLTLQGKFIHSIGETNRMLYRAQIGTTATSDFDQLPTTYRFFTGGDQTIRGYDYESISPRNDSGDLAGGKHVFVGSIEFEHQFAPQWAVAAFTDFGDAFSSEFKVKYSVGAGVRWFSPIGPVRVDIGVPLNTDENDFGMHVTIGPDL